MKTLLIWIVVIFVIACNEASKTNAGCEAFSRMYMAEKQHALIGHSFLTQSNTTPVQCASLCSKDNTCMSFNHDGTNGICQLNNARKEDFPQSFVKDNSCAYYFSLKQSIVETATESVQTTEDYPATTEGVEGPTVTCPDDAYSYIYNISPVQVQWYPVQPKAIDSSGKTIYSHQITCKDDDKGTTVSSGGLFEAGDTTITCSASDSAGNLGQCGFLVNVIVCESCVQLGMENGFISNAQITALNVLNDNYEDYGPSLARFNSNSSWCGQKRTGTYIQVDLATLMDIYGLIVQGLNGDTQTNYVAYFYISTSKDGVEWVDEMYQDGSRRKFFSSGAATKDVIVPLQSSSQSAISSRFIRIRPGGWNGNICMRFELIGRLSTNL